MKIVFEKLDDFLDEARQAVITDSVTKFYLSVIRMQSQDQRYLTAQLYLQFIKDNDVMMYVITDLPTLAIKNPNAFEIYLSPDDAAKAKVKYEEEIKQVDMKINEQYEKIKKVLEGYGYAKFIKATVE